MVITLKIEYSQYMLINIPCQLEYFLFYCSENITKSFRQEQEVTKNLWKSGLIQKYCAIVGYTCHFPDLPIFCFKRLKDMRYKQHLTSKLEPGG